jgi:Response regulator of the LytR/AlgR family
MAKLGLHKFFGALTFVTVKSSVNRFKSQAMNVTALRHYPDTPSPIARTAPFKTEMPVRHSKGLEKIALPTMDGICFEKVKHITHLEASGNYTVLHFKDKRQALVCKTLREVELMLPEQEFVRIHRSHTVHLRHIKKYVKGKGGHVVMQNGATLTVASGQKDLFLEMLREHFSF